MASFDTIFKGTSIYEMFFFNIKAVLIYPSLKKLEEDNKVLFERWKYISDTKYGTDFNGDDYLIKEKTLEKVYLNSAIQHSEFIRIVAITYATLYPEEGKIKRNFMKIGDIDEFAVIDTFMNKLYQVSSDGMKSTPLYLPMLCGHNITAYDIPLLIKKFLFYRYKFELNKNKQLPLILKKAIDAKPWENNIIDVTNVWKFNGYEYSSLMLIADYLNLKKTVDLMPHNKLSEYYWNNINEKPQETLDFMMLQSATQTNLVIQLMNELRTL